MFIVNNFLLEPLETIVGSLTLETVNASVEIRPDMAQVEIVDDDSKCVDAFMSVHLSICLFVSVCLSICLFVSVCLSICLSVYLSICLSVYLSACLPVCLFSLFLSVTDNYFTDYTPFSPRCDYWVHPRCLHGAGGCRLTKCHN